MILDHICTKINKNVPTYRFSVNFCCDSNPIDVAYHFKTDFTTNKVIHNYKCGKWNNEIIEDNTWVNGPGN